MSKTSIQTCRPQPHLYVRDISLVVAWAVIASVLIGTYVALAAAFATQFDTLGDDGGVALAQLVVIVVSLGLTVGAARRLDASALPMIAGLSALGALITSIMEVQIGPISMSTITTAANAGGSGGLFRLSITLWILALTAALAGTRLLRPTEGAESTTSSAVELDTDRIRTLQDVA